MGNYFKIKSQLLILKHFKISVYRVLGGLVTGDLFFTTVCNYGGCEVRSGGLPSALTALPWLPTISLQGRDLHQSLTSIPEPHLLPTPIYFYKMTTAWPDISPLTFQHLLTPTSSAVKSLQVRSVTTLSVPCHCCTWNTETCHCAPRKVRDGGVSGKSVGDGNSRNRCFHTEEVVMKRHLVISSSQANNGICQWGRERVAPFVSSEIPEGRQRGRELG